MGALSTSDLAAVQLARDVELVGDGPLHSQLADRLRELIDSGQLAPGATLPGELELAAALRLSRHTVRHALGALVDRGLLRRERGRGTRVLVGPERTLLNRSLNGFYAFAWDVRAQGLVHRSHVLALRTVRASRQVQHALAVDRTAPLKRLVRLRLADEEPLVIETAYFPAALLDGVTRDDLEAGSVYEAIERQHGQRVMRASERIRPVVLDTAQAALLGTAAGAPAFLVERTTWSATRAIEWQQSVVRGDRVLYSVDLAARAPETPGAGG